jgi:hypothetical protein
MLACLLRC